MANYDVLPLNRNARIEAYHFSERLAKCLSLEKTLKGHHLCVNRLAWNRAGTHLLSGSDDKRILMHAYPNYDKLPLSIATEHTANIFGVQFLPHSGDALLISGAMDHLVQIHRLDAAPSTKFQYPSALDRATVNGTEGEITSVEIQPETTVFACHNSRVKDVEVDEANPFVFWSVSEDGTLRQFDVRCDFGAQARTGAPNVLIGVRSQNGGDTVELKGLDINQACPHLMGVACGDPYVRIFDRRKLTLGMADSTFPEPLMKLSPPHLPMIGYIDEERCHSTYVHFSHSGDKIVSLFHGDHAYSFDISSQGTAACTYVQPSYASYSSIKNGHLRNGECSTDPSRSSPARRLQEEAQEMFNAGLRCELEGKMLKSIMYLDEAIRLDPRQVQFYNERAGCFIKRKVPGDLMFALRDADQAIALDPTQSESYFNRCQAFEALGQFQTAQRLLRSFIKRFPEKKRSEPVAELRQRIAEQVGKTKKQTTSKRSREAEEEDMQLEEDCGMLESEAGPSQSTVCDASSDDADCDDYLFPYYFKGEEELEEGSPGGIWWSTDGGRRLLTRYAGHRNVLTDIKECTFLGHNDALVACGSDGGCVFIYNAETGYPVNVLTADEDVCNCVQGHPTLACLATSGIESVVRLWTPTGEAVAESAVLNQVEDSLEVMKHRRARHCFHDPMLRRLRMMLDNSELHEMVLETSRRPDDGSDDEGDHSRSVDCRMV